ncbi:Nitrate reductase delta subunit [Natronorubrum sediminis]|uniref:Nitrate reductase delta subunit n=1 Tax=Natronorubrum sediminis TaxID=640943 RepID=A0A1H6G048_9EURY|nr:molecular chaperone TorD family protein [Natronorubrum sediminis]SEH16429.1 Nitrate reductase delta subunit [Natronorubrum sediminis]
MTQPSNTTGELAELYAFVSSVLADPPDEIAVERLSTEQFPAEASPQSLENGFRLLRQWQADVDEPSKIADELKRTHTKLFVGPRPRLQIYESWYADDYLGQPLAAVKSSYRDLNIHPTEDLKEEADHAAVELAALQTLARDGDDEHRRAFLMAHGWWLTDLATDLQEMVDDTFYEAIGWLVEGIVDLDCYLLSLDPNDLERGYDDSPYTPIEPSFKAPFEDQ